LIHKIIDGPLLNEKQMIHGSDVGIHVAKPMHLNILSEGTVLKFGYIRLTFREYSMYISPACTRERIPQPLYPHPLMSNSDIKSARLMMRSLAVVLERLYALWTTWNREVEQVCGVIMSRWNGESAPKQYLRYVELENRFWVQINHLNPLVNVIVTFFISRI